MLKYIFKALLILIAFVACTPLMMGQNSRLVVLEKPGKLSKHIKKDQYPNIQSLTIMGTLNNSDIMVLSKLSNLTELNLGHVEFEFKDYHPEKRPFVAPSNRSLTIPSLPNLVKITIPNSRMIESIDFGSLPNLRVLNTESDRQPEFVNIVQPLDTIIYSENWPVYSLSAKVAVLTDKSINKSLNSSDAQKLIKGEVLLSQKDLINRFSFSEVNILIVGNKKYLIKWTPKLTKEDLNDIQIIAPYAYKKYPDTKLELSRNVIHIYPEAFSNSIIKSIDLGNVSTLPSGIFKGCSNLQEIKLPSTLTEIGQEVFAGTKIQHLTLPASVKAINGKAFASSQLVDVEFLGEYPPEILEYAYKNKSMPGDPTTYYSKGFEFDGTIYVPQGRFSAYNIGEYKKASILEKGSEQILTFTVDKPGTLSQYITDDIAKSVVGLKINGTLYDTDFDAIYKCHNLRDLDLSHCFIMESYETAKQKHEEDAALLEMFSGLASMANANESAKFKAGVGNMSNVAYTKAASELFGKALKELESGKISPSDQCVFPNKPFYNNTNPFLRRIVFPIQMKKVPYIYEASNLTEIVLPPYAEEIHYRAFQFADINSITFPPTLKILGKECFIGTALKKVDLSNTQVEELDSAFERCNNLKTFKGNTKLKKLYGNIGNKDVVGYFYTPEKPEGIRFENFKTIHIPKGCKAGWSAPSYCNVEIVDDIVL